MFCFGGRRGNLELQLPHIRRILEENPQVVYHLWNLAKDPADAEWIRSGLEGIRMPMGRFIVRNEFAGPNPWERFGDIYAEYANPIYMAHDFVKIDDDVVFIQTARFGEFLRSIAAMPDTIVSAKVINNGACTPTEGPLYRTWQREFPRMKLLDVHKHLSYASLSHGYFFDHWQMMLDQENFLIPTEDWLSINLIGYNWNLGTKINALLGTPSPRLIAGRSYRPSLHRVGDEGAVNMLPRAILQGFLAAHLYFGPQAKQMTPGMIDGLRHQYGLIGKEYLSD
jgi:hypothetical protein